MIFKDNLIKAKDHLVSGEVFEILWEPSKGIAKTQIPSGLNLSRYYESQDYTSHNEKGTSFIDKIYSVVQNKMFRYKASLIKKASSNKTLFDFGAGLGAFCEYMKNERYHVSGLEPMDSPRAIAKEKGLPMYKSLESIPKTARYDIITLWHVLEHLPDPESTLETLAVHLNKNGIIVIAVPNLNSYESRFYAENWAAWDVPRHLWHFTSKGVTSLLQSKGFSLKETHPLWYDALYISYLSEKHRGSSFPFVRGIAIGLLSNLKARFTGEYSSLIYVFSKSVASEEG